MQAVIERGGRSFLKIPKVWLVGCNQSGFVDTFEQNGKTTHKIMHMHAHTHTHTHTHTLRKSTKTMSPEQ